MRISVAAWAAALGSLLETVEPAVVAMTAAGFPLGSGLLGEGRAGGAEVGAIEPLAEAMESTDLLADASVAREDLMMALSNAA